MDVVKYDGNGGTQTISSLAFSPDFVWIKGRNATPWHAIFDSVRGTGLRLSSNVTNAETGNGTTDLLQLFNSNGFTVNATLNGVPDSSVNWDGSGGAASSYVAWTWDAGTSTVSNTAGSITSQVRANPTAGFSVVTYTGNGTSGATVGHGLGVALSMMIIKKRSSTGRWEVYLKVLGPTLYLEMDVTNGAGGPYSGLWNNTDPTSTVFSIGNDSGVNSSGGTYVAYCFSSVVGYSSMGSYVGNGSADGPFVYTGHRTRWLMIKRTDASDSWQIMDAARSDYNVADDQLYADLSNAESSTGSRAIDFLSNGFKVRGDNSGINANGGTYVYLSFAESPFQYARAR